MNFCVKLLSIFLVLVMLASTVVSCAFQPNSNPPTQGGTTTNNGITVLPPNNDDNKEDINNGNHVGGVVVGNATAPYIGDVHVSAGVTPDENNQVPSEGVSLESATASATIPGGVQMEEGANELSLTINGIKDSSANVELSDTDVSTSLDVHVSGVAANNLVPMEVKLLAAALKGLNSTSITLYHVENGETIEMTYVPNDEPFTAHNQFKYDPVTGDVTLYIASFSEIAIVNDIDNAWEGKFDYTWYDASKTELTIANADQLAAFGAIVGGMNGQAQDSFAGKTVKLIADINLGDAEAENNPDLIFYPIGYNSSDGKYEKTGVAVSTGFYNFCGTFDGNGHTIENFYHNTWEMKGDHNWYAPEDQYFRDGMGLFGRLYKATVKNLTVKNFSSDGEIATTGVIAAYADGATFENISIFECNPRVYNIGNGGIVGCVGWYAKEANLKTTFKNITVDNSNKISALWGSYDVACGGIVGQYYPTSGQTSAGTPANGGISFENCHVSAVMDVYNDVCANYQYYAYRYTGMLIGSVRENVTIDGHVYPKMDGITAKYCTVHFGTWNDYYYCEIIDNTTASYTHDYQMSRLTQVSGVDIENKKYLPLGEENVAEKWMDIPTSGRVNYVVVNGEHATENATCYHFKNGEVWDHEKNAGTEIVNGVEVLVEDKQHIYLEFNNLVTGYGWGVTTKGVEDVDGVDILDREDASSVEKFENIKTDLTDNRVYKLGDIFSYVNNGVPLKTEGLLVSITNLDKVNNPVSATIVYDTTNWANSTIEFAGTGEIQITIQDYYFCTPTTIDVTIAEREPEVKFDVALNNGAFLHRVGNANDVTLKYLFSALGGVTIGSTVEVSIANISGEVTTNITSAKNWNDATLDFDGTGVVKVTITDKDWCTPTELYLEVVDAMNYPSASSGASLNATSNNVVLLSNIGGGFTVSGEYTFFGNGFTLTYTGNGQYLNNGLKQGVVMVENGGTLDNLRIVAPIYPKAYLYYGATSLGDYVQGGPSSVEGDKTRYHYQLSAVATYSNATISNCYIYGGRTNIYVNTGNVTIKDTILECGTVANVQIQSTNEYTVTLENVTTIQHQVKSTVGDTTKTMLGTGILVGPDTTSNPTIVLNGTLKQYNWVTLDDANAVSDTKITKAIIEGALNATAYNHTVNGKTASNLGIIYMNEETVNVQNKTGLPYEVGNVAIKMSGNTVNGKVYSVQNATADQIYSDYANADRTTVNGDYIPTFEFDLGTQEDTKDSDSDNRYLYGDKNGLSALYQDGNDPITLNINQLATIYKYDGLPYSITAVCKDANGNALTANNGEVTLDAQGSYTLEFTVNDNIFYNVKGETVTKSVKRIYIVPLTLTVKAADIKNAVVSITKTSLDGTYTTVNLTDYKLRINFIDCISITDYDNKGSGTTVSLSSNIASATLTPSGANVFSSAFTVTVTYTDGRVLTVNFSNISGSSPGTKTAVVNTSGGLYFITEGALNNKPTEASSQNKCTITSVSFKGNSGSTITNDTDVTVTWALGSSGGSSPCVTGDTLVTLADGSQVRIDSLTGNELVKVWDFYKGEYTVAPIAILQNHGYETFDEVKLIFSDGTTINTINGHGFFDIATNKFVLIDKYNVADYVGHEFVKYDAENEYSTVTLVDYRIEARYEQIYSILTAVQYNCLLNDLWTLTAAEVDNSPEWLMPYEIGEDMKYDAEKMQADIEKYGLYTYEDFAGLCTYEEFVALGLENFKVSVGKGAITWEDILFLINLHLN